MSQVRSLAVFSAALAVAGCYAYGAAPLATIQPKHEIRVTDRDGRRVELVNVTVVADTLRGLTVRRSFLQSRRDRVALAVADLTKVEVRRVNVGRSILVAGALAAAIVVPALVVDWDHVFESPSFAWE